MAENRCLSQNITFNNMIEQLNINVSRWIENLEKKGRISFSLNPLEEELPNYSGAAINSALKQRTNSLRNIFL